MNTIIRFAIAESPAVLGLILTFQTETLPFVWTGSAIAFLLLLLNKPSAPAA
jgi:hypothetical protein